MSIGIGISGFFYIQAKVPQSSTELLVDVYDSLIFHVIISINARFSFKMLFAFVQQQSNPHFISDLLPH